MCRFLVYKGSDEILLSKLILDPTHSILKQSFDARLRLDTRRGQNNADGFGIGFYTDPKLGQAPCLFRSTIPAWNCANLERLASKTASRLVFAHVRAAPDGTLSEDNCHPFSHGSLMFMHNGGLGAWKHIKRRLAARLADRWYHTVRGGTDSEWAFALLLDTLARLGCDPSAAPAAGFGPGLLRRAMLRTIAIINELIDAIPEADAVAAAAADGAPIDTRSLLNFALSDGHSVICTRYINSRTDQAASLYYSSGTRWEQRPPGAGDRDYEMQRRDKGADVVLVASEPLTFERENWVNVPTNSILTIHGQTVMVHPIVDAYTNRGPAHARSAAFVQTKGLVANEKTDKADRVDKAAAKPGRPDRLSLRVARHSHASHVPAAPVVSVPDVVVEPPPPPAPKRMGPTIPVGAFRPPPRPHQQHQSDLFHGTARARSSVLSSVSVGAVSNGSSSSAGPSGGTSSAGAVLPGHPPAQGNIKKKRMSLSELDQVQAQMQTQTQTQGYAPIHVHAHAHGYGNPHAHAHAHAHALAHDHAHAHAYAGHAYGGHDDDTEPTTPDSPSLPGLPGTSDSPTSSGEPPRNNYGDPNKIAQFFPELSTLTT